MARCARAISPRIQRKSRKPIRRGSTARCCCGFRACSSLPYDKRHRSLCLFVDPIPRVTRSRKSGWLSSSGSPKTGKSLRHSHQLKHVTVRVLEINASAAIPIVELAIVETPRSAAMRDLRLLDATENGIKLGIAHVEG